MHSRLGSKSMLKRLFFTVTFLRMYLFLSEITNNLISRVNTAGCCCNEYFTQLMHSTPGHTSPLEDHIVNIIIMLFVA